MSDVVSDAVSDCRECLVVLVVSMPWSAAEGAVGRAVKLEVGLQ